VSQLKKALPSSHQVSDIIPVPDDCWQFPEQVLAKKMVSRGTSSTQQVLIKWSGWPEALATWEDMEALHQRFPGAPTWGQAGSLGGGARMSAPLLPSTLQGKLGLGGHLGPTFLMFVFLAWSGTGPINLCCTREPASSGEISSRTKRERDKHCINENMNSIRSIPRFFRS
jgi:hypothetical protein